MEVANHAGGGAGFHPRFKIEPMTQFNLEDL